MILPPPKLCDMASPQKYITAGNLPPFYIFNGDADTVVPPVQNDNFYNALIAAGCDAQHSIMSGQGHGVFNVAPIPTEVNTFLDNKFKNA